ncbi:ferredoxin reductase family protein [Cognatishimia maritima]|uniref:Predicted ferric reductase n=1 Tax=Cognatishimia maritima TaxID=870908 RepID=A0A1M5MLS5_9RHOB|nr:ferric reductase-like transmembrane domain-containing protein [Cognatishimia maritima]SHG78195.1 Predicted ferric reductase [Cognatishimia maritima]
MRLNPIGLIPTVVAILTPIMWLPALNHGGDALALFSQYMGMAALIAMAIVQLIATRWRIVEWVFGGLDQAYVFHKWLGISAMAFILLHDTIDADMRHLGGQNLLEELAETLGEFSLYGLLILVVITVATFVPYHLWRWTHRLMGFFFVAGAAHFLFILKPFDNSDPIGLYTAGFCVLGIICFSYRLLPARLRPSRRYVVESIESTGQVQAITLKPESRPMRYRAGQFAFASFHGAEPHPFTVSKAPSDDGHLRFSVARLGDFTTRLHRNLAVGTQVAVEGPFGHFEYRDNGRQQLWIGAGVGITPFLAWAQALGAEDSPVHLIYCVKSEAAAAHLDELKTLAHTKPNLTLHIHSSTTQGRLDAAALLALTGQNPSQLTVAFCGPKPMRAALKDGFAKEGVSGRHFKYEEFEIRTGVGLQTLANALFNRIALPEQIKNPLQR